MAINRESLISSNPLLCVSLGVGFPRKYLKDFTAKLQRSTDVLYDEAYAINLIPPCSFCVVSKDPDTLQIKWEYATF